MRQIGKRERKEGGGGQKKEIMYKQSKDRSDGWQLERQLKIRGHQKHLQSLGFRADLRQIISANTRCLHIRMAEV